MTPNFCAQAKYYAAFGLRVLPLPPGRKGPPLLQDWPQKATTEPETISGWWSTWPQAGIGVAMGAGSALVDIESDIKPGVDGEKSLEVLDLPDTWSFRSGGGGIHRLFRCNNPDIPNRVNMLPGVDVRANGGYAVFPPSRHPSGQYYTWLPGHSPQDMPQGPAPLPFELFSMIMETEKKAPLEVPREIPEGRRNDLLFRQACKLRRGGLTEVEILGAIRSMNDSRCNPPLDDNEVETICRQAAKYEAGDLPEARNGENTFTARELMAAELGETRYIVVDLLPQGLSLLASPPKYGKSWLVLDLCISAAQGGLFLGHPANKCGVLYLALEDGPRRLKKRMKKLLDGEPAPDNLIFKTEAPDLSNGLLDVLDGHGRDWVYRMFLRFTERPGEGHKGDDDSFARHNGNTGGAKLFYGGRRKGTCLLFAPEHRKNETGGCCQCYRKRNESGVFYAESWYGRYGDIRKLY